MTLGIIDKLDIAYDIGDQIIPTDFMIEVQIPLHTPDEVHLEIRTYLSDIDGKLFQAIPSALYDDVIPTKRKIQSHRDICYFIFIGLKELVNIKGVKFTFDHETIYYA